MTPLTRKYDKPFRLYSVPKKCTHTYTRKTQTSFHSLVKTKSLVYYISQSVWSQWNIFCSFIERHWAFFLLPVTFTDCVVLQRICYRKCSIPIFPTRYPNTNWQSKTNRTPNLIHNRYIVIVIYFYKWLIKKTRHVSIPAEKVLSLLQISVS